MTRAFSMRLATLLKQPPAWLSETGEAEDIVIATEAEYRRNLADYSFSGWAKAPERAAIFQEIRRAVEPLPAFKGGFFTEMPGLSLDARRLLVERQLMTRTLAPRQKSCGIAISRQQNKSLQINDEEHLTLRVFRHGLHIEETWRNAASLLAELETSLRFARDERLGYLMSAPNAVGRGFRLSVILHLPALTMANMMPQVYAAAEKLHVGVKGLYGNGEEAIGNLYEFSNISSFDESEQAVLERMEYIAFTLAERERGVRYKYLTEHFMRFADHIERSVGLLNYAMRLGFRETMDNLSNLRLGAMYKLVNWSERDREEATRALPQLAQTVSSAYLRLHTVASDLPGGDDIEAMRSFHVRQMLFPALPFGISLDANT